MGKRSVRLASGVLAAAGTWLLLARFVELQRVPAERDAAMLAAGAAFAAYLFTIGYWIYLRAYWFPERTKPRLGPLARWMLTIALVSALGVTIGLRFPQLAQTSSGQLLVMSVTFGAVAIGLVLTVTAGGRAPARPTDRATAPPSFLGTAFRLVVFLVAVYAAGALLLGPVFWLQHEFKERIDVPACREQCTSHGYTYRDFIGRKGGVDCICADGSAPHIFHDRGLAFGGHGTGATAADWLFRFTTTILVALGWPALVLSTAAFLWARSKSKAQPSLKD